MGVTASKMNEAAITRRIARNLLNLNEILYVSAANPACCPKLGVVFHGQFAAGLGYILSATSAASGMEG